MDTVRDHLAGKWDRLDGALHAIGFAPPSCLGGGFMDAPWDDVAIARDGAEKGNGLVAARVELGTGIAAASATKSLTIK